MRTWLRKAANDQRMCIMLAAVMRAVCFNPKFAGTLATRA